VCHPHPLYGGTMDNKVRDTVPAHSARRARPPFASISAAGATEGAHDGARRDEMRSRIRMPKRASDLPLCSRFFFGGAVRARDARVEFRIVLVARRFAVSRGTAWVEAPEPNDPEPARVGGTTLTKHW
jgi:alpha/beta superfamily hydrolase